MGSKGGNTTTSQFKPPAEFMKAYKEALGMARGAVKQPYEQYSGNLVAGMTPSQMQGISNVNAAQGMALPAIQKGMEYTQQAAQGITPELYNRFYSPYVKDVADTTFANLMESQAQQQSGLKSGAIQAGAFGGDRSGIAQAEMARQQQLANAMSMSNIYNQGYGQAMGLAGQQVANLGAMGQQVAGLGAGAQASVLQGAQAQMAAGAQQQATEQARLQAAYDQWMQRQSYPYQQAQFFANIAQGLGAGAGGTSSTTAPSPNIGSQILGGLGAIGSIYGASDERVKENIEPVGNLNDGQTIYRYNFKGDPKTQIGLLAQEVEHHKPGAVAQIKGLKMVNYKDATEDAASMGGAVVPSEYRQGLAGGGVPYHPYETANVYVPEGKIAVRGSNIPDAPKPFEDKGLAEDWKNINPISEAQASGLRKLASDVGIDLPEKGGLAAIFKPTSGGLTEAEAVISRSNPGYDVSGYHFASGGLVSRHHYAGGGVMDQAIDEAAGLSAVPEYAPPAGLVRAESGGDFGAKNKQGYVGRMQFGEDRLTDAKRAGVIPADMTAEDFRLNPEAQKATEAWHFSDINNFIDSAGLAGVEGKAIKGIPVTREGLVNVAHLGGKGGLQKFVASGGRYDPADANGTRLSDYLALGAGSGGVGGATPIPASAEVDGLGAIAEPASAEGLGGVEQPKGGLNFDMKKLFASEQNPSVIEKIMGRRLSPEARSAIMNASFALMAGRSPFFFTNLGEAGKVGTQTYYNALGRGVEVAATQAETQRKIFEIQKANAEFYGPLLQNAIINNNGILPQNMVPLLRKMGPFAEAYISSVQGQLPGGNVSTEPVISAPQMPQTAPVAPPPAPAASPGGVSGGASEMPPATGEEGIGQPSTTPTVPAATSTSASPQTPDLRIPFLRPVDDPIALQAAKTRAGPAMAPIYDAKIDQAIARIAANNGSYLGADGKLHAYPGWQELVAQQESLKTRAQESAKADYDLVEVVDPTTNQKVRIPRSQALKNANVSELSPLQTKGIETLAKQQSEIGETYDQLQTYRNQLGNLARLMEHYRTGMGQQEVGQAIKAMRALGMDTSGIDETSDPADMEKFIKGQYTAVFNQIKSLGSRFTNLEMSNMIKANPNPSLEPEANASIMAQLIGAVDHDIARADAFNQWISENPGATDIGAFLKEFYSNPENMPLEFQKRAAKDVAYIGMDVPTLPDGTYDYRKLIPGKRYVIQDPATEEYSAWIYGGNKNWLPAPISAVTP